MAAHRDWPVCVRLLFAKEFMNFITIGAFFERVKTIRAALLQARGSHDLPHQPYAFLSASDLRGLVAAMVD